jgi:hypothetical protein
MFCTKFQTGLWVEALEQLSPYRSTNRKIMLAQDSRLPFSFTKTHNHPRSGGMRGAGVEILRGTKGADFEGSGRVTIGQASTGCGGRGSSDDGSGGVSTGCLGGLGFVLGRWKNRSSSSERKEKHLLIKGTYCFVFYDATDLAPKYAIELNKVKPFVRTSSKSGRVVVTLESKGVVGYEIDFGHVELAKAFRDAVAQHSIYVNPANFPMVRFAVLLCWLFWFGVGVCLEGAVRCRTARAPATPTCSNTTISSPFSSF